MKSYGAWMVGNNVGQELRRVYKAHGAGNDFVLLVGFGEHNSEQMAAAACELCDRHRSIGADGLVWIDTASLPSLANVRVWNPDGSAVGMCLNAARCVLVLLCHLYGITQLEIRFQSVVVQARLTPGGARLQFVLNASAPHTAAAQPIGHDEWFVSLADPHVVIGWDEELIDHAPLKDIALARALMGTLSDLPPNCHLVTGGNGSRRHHIRSFERRVEAETLACGSGCVASYLALELDGEHVFHTKSGDAIRLAKGVSHWSLEGPAMLVFDTDVHIAAFADAALV